MSRICMIGTGYVGLVTGTCLADFGYLTHAKQASKNNQYRSSSYFSSEHSLTS